MGHTVGKDVYRRLGRKIDGLTMRAPWSDSLRAILEELYSEEDARLVAAMPYGFSTLGRLQRVTGHERGELERLLASLCPRGLVIDVHVGGTYRYAPSPMVIGIFELTMMRTGGRLPHEKWAKLFREYLEEGPFAEAMFGDGQRVSIMRAVPHDGSIGPAGDDPPGTGPGTVPREPSSRGAGDDPTGAGETLRATGSRAALPAEYVEVLDYEKAAAIIDATDRFAIGLCSCRHEHRHLGDTDCDALWSRFLSAMRGAAIKQGKGAFVEV